MPRLFHFGYSIVAGPGVVISLIYSGLFYRCFDLFLRITPLPPYFATANLVLFLAFISVPGAIIIGIVYFVVGRSRWASAISALVYETTFIVTLFVYLSLVGRALYGL